MLNDRALINLIAMHPRLRERITDLIEYLIDLLDAVDHAETLAIRGNGERHDQH